MIKNNIKEKYNQLLSVAEFTDQVKNLVESGIKFTNWKKYNHHRIYINRFEYKANEDKIKKTDKIGMIDLKDDSNTYFDINKLDDNDNKENLLKIIINEYYQDKIKEVN